MKHLTRYLLPIFLAASYLSAQCAPYGGKGTFKNSAPPLNGLAATWLVQGVAASGSRCLPSQSKTVAFNETAAQQGISDVNFIMIRSNTRVWYKGVWRDQHFKLDVGQANVTVVRHSSGPTSYEFIVTGATSNAYPKWVPN